MGGAPCSVLVLVVVLGGAAVLAAIPGPKNRRYPDYIVDPKVTCLKEGVFPHPRNCSWYYRCVDRMNVGIYWTYFFECEPGTVFSDSLDQCIHPFLAEGPCGIPVTEPPTTTPETEIPFIKCSGVEGTCKEYEVCQPARVTRTFCDRIKCPLRTPELSCAQGYSFDMDNRICSKPPAASTLCGATTTINITEMGELPCSYSNLRPFTEFISRILCDTYVLCDGSGYKGKKELCRNYYECEREGNGWTAHLRSCPVGLLYSYAADKCERKPTESERC